jgi:hypothetical protein
MLIAVAIGTLLQVAMVTIGHSNNKVKSLFASGGMGISLVAGFLYACLAAPATMMPAVTGGAIAGGVCAFIGIAVSYYLKDVPSSLLALGTVSSVVTGAIGGWLRSLVA